MLGIGIRCIQHSQAMLECGVCELAHSFFHFQRNALLLGQKALEALPWVKGIQVCSNKRPCPFPRRDNYEIVKNIEEI